LLRSRNRENGENATKHTRQMRNTQPIVSGTHKPEPATPDPRHGSRRVSGEPDTKARRYMPGSQTQPAGGRRPKGAGTGAAGYPRRDSTTKSPGSRFRGRFKAAWFGVK